MNYWIVGRKKFYLLVLSVSLILAVCFAGAWKLAVQQTNSTPRELPIYSVETKQQEKLVSMGINCAWEAEDIPQILDTLDQYQIKATFFLVGDWCDRYPDMVKQIDQRGHEIGNHSDSHPDLPSLQKQEIIAEIASCSRKITAITGKQVRLFRCPSGSYNDQVIKIVKEQGMIPIQWSLDSLDWKGTSTEEMIQRIVPKLTYGDILLFHNDTQYTAQSLGKIIEEVQNKGYTFVPVGDLILPGEYQVDVTGRQYPKTES